MKWVYSENLKRPIKSWCTDIEHEAMEQAKNLANHPVVFRHVALMPDCHVGYGMPIGGVIACDNSVIPNAVGVDIGCGMGAIETDLADDCIQDKRQIRELCDLIKQRVPVGEGNSHRHPGKWANFEKYLDNLKGEVPGWLDNSDFTRDAKNLGTLGGGNHFIELQKSETGKIWLMLHSGSRNLGYRIANYYGRKAIGLNEKWHVDLPDKNLAFLTLDEDGMDYIRDMNFALDYAFENRKRMMHIFKEALVEIFGNVNFLQEINIHHNYAKLENHFNKNVWVHRKGATSAGYGQKGIIPGSMGTSSFIVEGLGNSESFNSCSHGAGRVLGRKQACEQLNLEDCDKAMEGIVFDRWKKSSGRNKNGKKLIDLSESPLAYKDIDEVIESELDLIKPLVRLKPLGVIKG
ncbi:MAG: RtcB family protein [Spirochaetes bacterium]|nr:RtcB family protein [Spirochaetota bacterium]